MLSDFPVVFTDQKSTAELLPAERATRLKVDSEVCRNSTDKNDEVTTQYNYHRVVVHLCRSGPVHPKVEDALLPWHLEYVCSVQYIDVSAARMSCHFESTTQAVSHLRLRRIF